jgi:hypothetical protein
MGNEASCKVRFNKRESQGKALLETSEILFRGDFRLKIPFSTIKSSKAWMANSTCRSRRVSLSFS